MPDARMSALITILGSFYHPCPQNGIHRHCRLRDPQELPHDSWHALGITLWIRCQTNAQSIFVGLKVRLAVGPMTHQFRITFHYLSELFITLPFNTLFDAFYTVHYAKDG
jgi:hypothetical protein